MNASTSPLSDSLDSLRDAWSTISQLVESLSLPSPSASASSSSAPAPTSEVSRLTREVAELPQHLSDLLLLGTSVVQGGRLCLSFLAARSPRPLLLTHAPKGRTEEACAAWEAKRPVLAKWVEMGVKGAEAVERECTEVLAEAGGEGEAGS
jgi:hypothetical protein